MQRFFIADIHLNDNEPVITTGFLHFLADLPDHCELYILGDLFDYWIGDDLTESLQDQVANALSALATRHITSYFVHGNRDFLLGHRYAKACQMTLLSDVNVLPVNQQNLLILHGDLLCTDDISYQNFRRKMHNKWLQRLFLMLPRFIRKNIATKLRNKSQQHNQHKAQYIMDVNQTAVIEMMTHYHADIMIHGHTHKPATHRFTLDTKPVERIVLGAWHDGVNYIHQDENGQVKLIQC